MRAFRILWVTVLTLLSQKPIRGELGRSGFLDADTFLNHAEMWLGPEAYKRFHQFYAQQMLNDRYGCHCQLKDLVSQDYIDYQDGRDHFQYYGQPVDALDRSCHNHRECLRCARMELGCASDGISEHYLHYKINGRGYCSDNAGSCERAYCECAQQFILDIHNDGIYGYNQDYSRQIGGFEASPASCPRLDTSERVGVSVARRNLRRNVACCSSNNLMGPWRLYNRDRYRCCEDGTPRPEC
jgi:hypothetical protein